MYIVYSSSRSLEFIQRAQLSRFPRAEGRFNGHGHGLCTGHSWGKTLLDLTEPRKWIFIEYVDNFRAVLASRFGARVMKDRGF
jgi:hypothetical protein